jgi:release factor glutamine methyltransferase
MSRTLARKVMPEIFAYSPKQTIGEVLRLMTRALAEGGIESAQHNARFLLQGLLGLDGVALLTRSEQSVGDLAPLVNDAQRRRLAHEPVSRILGVREFYGREFLVTPDVLDPRPDTETVVDLALDVVRSRGLMDRAITIADIGTGSGILIATLLAELPKARGIATDISPKALEVARQNARRHGVADRIIFSATRGLGAVDGPLDLVVSNPPYIASDEIPALEADVREYDPHVALDGGPDGLQIYREIAQNIVNLQHSPRLVLEVGAEQAADVQTIFAVEGWALVDQRKDLGGHVRAVALEIHS